MPYVFPAQENPEDTREAYLAQVIWIEILRQTNGEHVSDFFSWLDKTRFGRARVPSANERGTVKPLKILKIIRDSANVRTRRMI